MQGCVISAQTGRGMELEEEEVMEAMGKGRARRNQEVSGIKKMSMAA